MYAMAAGLHTAPPPTAAARRAPRAGTLVRAVPGPAVWCRAEPGRPLVGVAYSDRRGSRRQSRRGRLDQEGAQRPPLSLVLFAVSGTAAPLARVCLLFLKIRRRDTATAAPLPRVCLLFRLGKGRCSRGLCCPSRSKSLKPVR